MPRLKASVLGDKVGSPSLEFVNTLIRATQAVRTVLSPRPEAEDSQPGPGGYHIYPQEIEAVIVEIPGVDKVRCSAKPAGNGSRRSLRIS